MVANCDQSCNFIRWQFCGARDARPIPVAHGRGANREHANKRTGVGIKISGARKAHEYPRVLSPLSKLVIFAVECTGRFSKDALAWCKDIAKREFERRRPAHLPAETAENEQGVFNPEAIKKYHYNVAEAQLELHGQNMEWCIGTITKARNQP